MHFPMTPTLLQTLPFLLPLLTLVTSMPQPLPQSLNPPPSSPPPPPHLNLVQHDEDPQTKMCRLKTDHALHMDVSPAPKRNATSNGCGGGQYNHLIPEFGFHDCCTTHDLCYGKPSHTNFLSPSHPQQYTPTHHITHTKNRPRKPDSCTTSWHACNDAFNACMHGVCDAIRHGDLSERFKCHIERELFEMAVNTVFAKAIYKGSVRERCACFCEDGGAFCKEEGRCWGQGAVWDQGRCGP